MQQIEPDYEIIIGIKNNDIVKVDWSDMHIKFFNRDRKYIINSIIKYLKKSIKFIRVGTK